LLLYALEDYDLYVRERAAEALKKIGTPKALKAVEKYEKSF
jgi:HEAT repeat protein